MKRSWGGLLLVAASLGCAEAPKPDARFLAKWMEVHFALARSERLSPLVASRIAAYGAVALYEGMVHGSDSLESLAGQLNGLDSLPQPAPRTDYDWPTVAISAERTVLESLLADAFANTRIAIGAVADSQLSARKASGLHADAFLSSAQYGSAIGKGILEWAAKDGFARTRAIPYKPPTGRQFWVNTFTPDQFVPQSLSAASDFVALDNPAAVLEPGSASERTLLMNRPRLKTARTLASINPTRALEPHWGSIRPFALRSSDECAARAPFPYSETPGSPFHQQGMAVYNAGKSLSPGQREIAFFWADTPGQTGTPAGHWLSIVGQLVGAMSLSPDAAIEAYALSTLAIADAFIACWRAKYQWNVPRPVTYLRRVQDQRWQPLIVTPPFPEYTSGHSTLSAAAATILAAKLGDREFTDSTQVPLGHRPRRLKSFTAAAQEAAISRLYGGIHYPMAIDEGLVQGRCVGNNILRRVHTRKGT